MPRMQQVGQHGGNELSGMWSAAEISGTSEKAGISAGGQGR